LAENIKINDIRKAEFAGAGAAMVIGFFDGVHRGHQEIIGRCIKKAAETSGISMALTFDRPPVNIIKNGIHKKMILTYEDKISIIEGLGIDKIITVEIDEDFLDLTPEDFCRDILIGLFDIKHLYIGRGFRFGRNASGDTAFLRRYLGDRDIMVNEVGLVYSRGKVISSTMIRKYYAGGNIKRIRQLLGRDPFIRGKVVKGAGRGSKLGIPTANMEPGNCLVLPKDGVYAGTVSRSESPEVKMPSVINIGDNPTFGDIKRRVESHILDFDKKMNGCEIMVDFLERLRREIKFNDPDELKKQVAKDIIMTRRYFKRCPV
jgi:riboflavin kinase / FMN adenylyltransferase